MVDVIGNFSEKISGKRSLFLLVIATTDVSLIPGITIAGATEELTLFTPAADAEFLVLGKCKVINSVPVTPTGIPTPAIITKASLSLLNIPKLVVDAGSKIKPNIPYISLNGEPGKDIRKRSLDPITAERIIENGITLGNELSKNFELLVIGESIAAGTTTAMATLLGLGYDAIDKVSSASPENPKEIKRKVVLEAIKDLPSNFIDKISKLADPMLLGVAGITVGFKGNVLLAGGTQMTAASAIIKEINKKKMNDIGIGTTRWIINDKSSDIISLSKEVGVNLSYVNLDFSASKFDGLKAYERGYVKEGVGAGGSSLLATLNGITEANILKRIEEIYEEIRV
ncbi:nicotinate mononucleotide-dependent phosphoribosyltransferase CobT [Acidianus brierleyi]|uniref:UPF0284 protein DFR85_01445 n=1 Tax=Acidianus brierleyi TaxID=41673 RepID=A0A2U9IBT1_9CREN|nr:TIGR00303 family protein [Acidianus brierleyi]AWR93471.1 TIGR00303 family protein [Acidianus brierleyi]